MLKTLLVLLLATLTAAFANSPSTQICEPEKSVKSFVNHVGFAFEERPFNLNVYAFFNQLIHNQFFYELRAYYFHDFISTNPPLQNPPIPVSQERNQDGCGALVILGHVLHLGSKVEIMPFTRWQLYYNAFFTYRDHLGNRIDSLSLTGYLGLKFTGQVNDALSIYAQYFGGYEWGTLFGHGIFAHVPGHKPHANALVSTIELGSPYRFCKSWVVTPILQFNIVGNNPNSTAILPPFNISKLTTSYILFAIRTAYKF